jgi:phosphoglycolate phosphatase
MEKKGIIFDMDGTIWDSAAAVAKCWDEVVQRDLSVTRRITTEDVCAVMGKTMDKIAEVLFPDLTYADRMKLLDTCCAAENAYLAEHGALLYPELEQTLHALQKDYHLYIVSNCQKGYIEAFLDHYSYWHFFEDIECYGNNELGKGDNIRLLAARNGLTKAVYVGDIQGDYEAATQAGVSFIHAAYGFGRVNADVPRIQTFSELTAVVPTVL